MIVFGPCRYIQAATSPKDIIIMVDISGSMKGLKMTIAKHTINTILDTLGENDFVNIIAVRTTVLLSVPLSLSHVVSTPSEPKNTAHLQSGEAIHRSVLVRPC